MTGKHFDDLTQIGLEDDYGYLDKCTRRRLFQAWLDGAQLQERVSNDTSTGFVWTNADHAFWRADCAYRLRPEPLTKPSFPWELLPPEFRWIVKDSDLRAFALNYPVKRPDPWPGACWSRPHASGFIRIDQFTCYSPGSCDWRDSLVERPEGV